MNTVGFLALAHPDYISDGCAADFTARARAALEAGGISLSGSGKLLTDPGAAAEEARALLCEGCGGVILFFATWIECPVAMAAVCELKQTPLFLWGFPMWTEGTQERSTGSYVSHAMFRGVLSRIGVPFAEALGMPEDAPTVGRALTFCRAASAKARLNRTKIGLVGYTSMSIYTGTFDHVLMRWLIGPEIEQSDSYSLIQSAERFSKEEKDAAAALLKEKAVCSPSIRPERLEKAMGLYLAIEELKREKRLDAINIKCQYEFSKEYGMTVCVPLSLAADESFVASCEGDILCTVSMLILQYLTGQVIGYGDAITHEGGTMKLSPCGFMPYQLAAAQPLVDVFEAEGFSGLQNCFTMKPGRVTVFRLIEDVGTYHMLCAAGEGLATTKLRSGRFPALDVVLDCDPASLFAQCAGQHFALCYSDVTRELETLASMLGIGFVKVTD